MIKKLALSTGLVAATMTAALIGSSPVSAAELKLASFVGARHVMNRLVFAPWAKEIGAMSGGSLNISMHVGGSLGKGPAKQFKRAVDRVADITWGLQGYTSRQFRRSTLIEFSSTGANAVDATKRMWAAYDKYLSPEYSRVKVLAIWALDVPMLHTKSKRIEKISDLKGLKIRTPSQAQAKLIAALGATPLAMPVTKLYNALDRGLVDGVLISTSAINNFKLTEVTKYHTTGIPWGMSPFFAVMNKQTYDGLSPEHRALIDKTSGERLSLKAAAAYDADARKGVEAIKAAKGHEIITLPKAEVDKALAMLRAAEDKMLGDLEKEGVPGREILAALRNPGG